MSADITARHEWAVDPVDGQFMVRTGAGEEPRHVHRGCTSLDALRARLEVSEADLLDIATMVFTSDRLAPRPRGDRTHQLSWRRTIELRLPVRQPARWNQSILHAELEQTLGELTGDDWTLRFYKSPKRPPSIVQMEFPPAGPVLLFSGGMDSLAGTLEHLEAGGPPPILVSVSSNKAVAGQQSDLVDELRRHAPHLVHYRFEIHNVNTELREQARAQRARSFFYFVVAALVARRTGSHAIHVLENGVTSLNLPISPILTSTRATRTTHPLVLLAFEQFIRHALAWPEFEAALPHFTRTKAEMTRPHAARFAPLLGATVSCAHVRVANDWCGTCTACLLRRQVLWAAGLESIDRVERLRYRRDIFATFTERTAQDNEWYFYATVDHVGRLLRAPSVVADDPLVLRAAQAWATRHDTRAADVLATVVDLHQRYALEWRELFDRCGTDYPQLASWLRGSSLMRGMP